MINKTEYLINVFEDTKEISEILNDTIPSTKKTSFLESEFGDNPHETELIANISVINCDTVSALSKYSRDDKTTCVLNMASERRAGGGVANGAMAQEECLFRCSNLFETVTQDYYPLQTDECLYTSDASFFKDVKYETINPVRSDVITIAALNLNKEDNEGVCIYSDEEYIEITKRKIRMMFVEAGLNFVDNIILGAWGCGVFKNDPRKMATMFKEVMEEGYENDFDNIVFAIINDHNSVDSNYEIFKEIFV